jgi:mannose-6-phosphate isomerase-like protein (cupin superfamily)
MTRSLQMRQQLTFVAIVALCSATLGAQKPRPRRTAEQLRRVPDFIEAKDLGEKAIWLARGNYVGMTVLTAGDEQTSYIIVRRTTNSQPEWHARWDDIVVVRKGTGAVVFGDTLIGSTLRAPGERRGGRFSDKTFQMVLNEGDVVRIPAAVPHAFIVSGGEPLEYLVIKVRRQNLPIRWTTERDVLTGSEPR